MTGKQKLVRNVIIIEDDDDDEYHTRNILLHHIRKEHRIKLLREELHDKITKIISRMKELKKTIIKDPLNSDSYNKEILLLSDRIDILESLYKKKIEDVEKDK
jgi:predicted small metal-binding protein